MKPAGQRQGEMVQRRKLDAPMLKNFFEEIARACPLDTVTFICIGTDRSTGDALGPLVGSRLVQYGFTSVIGTMPEPCDAETLAKRVSELPEGRTLIAIDACLGTELSVGSYLVAAGPLTPAESVGGLLPTIGDYSLAAVVNRMGPRPYQTLQMTSLYKVMTMAEEIASAAASAFGFSTPMKN